MNIHENEIWKFRANVDERRIQFIQISKDIMPSMNVKG